MHCRGGPACLATALLQLHRPLLAMHRLLCSPPGCQATRRSSGLPAPLQIYSVESHRLALALDRRGLLVQIVRSAVLHAMGLTNKDNVRLANLF